MRIDLVKGAYTGRSIIADDQRCVNLFVEVDSGESPFPTTHYPAPGLKLLGTAPNNAGCRCLYRVKSTGALYGVYGNTVYAISQSWAFTSLGTLATSSGIVSMADNGFDILIVDGTATSYTMTVSGGGFKAITDANYYGSTRADICDTYFVTNRPGTQNWQISLANQAAWDPLGLDIASKTSAPDNLQVAIVMNDYIWLIGQMTSEVWYNTGASDFTFGKMPGVMIEHGTVAPYSVCKYDLSIYWLSQNEAGQYIVMRGNNLAAERVSTHAIEAEIGNYGDVSDAIGFCFQIGGHAFYQLSFPGADKTWVYDQANGQWHERVWIDSNGVWHRHRAQCATYAYGLNICGDWQNGNLYQFDLSTYNDAGNPIIYLRTFPHMVQDGKRVTYQRFIADMEVGTLAGTTADDPPMVSLRWSDDRGVTFGNPVLMPLGAAGQYDTSVQWWGLGMARDRVFELSWSVDTKTALNGAWVEAIPHKT